MAARSTHQDPIAVFGAHYWRLVHARISRITRITQGSRAARLLGTIIFILALLGGGAGAVRFWQRREDERARGRRLLRRNSGLRGKDGSRTIYVPYKSSSSKVTIHPTKATTFDAHRRLFLHPPLAAGLGDEWTTTTTMTGPVPAPGPATKAGLNLAFLHQFLSLLSIMLPRWNSKEAGLLLSHGGFLIVRTYLSLVVARLDGALVRDLVAGNGRGFAVGLVQWCGLGAVASYTNAMIRFLQCKVSIAFRTRLTRYIHDLYLNDHLNYYKLTNVDGGVGHSPDQLITHDVTVFCASAAALYSSLGKPAVDLVVFNYQLYRSLGPLALAGLLANYVATATLLRRLSPPFAKLKAVEGRREGEFRALHARLIANAEEIAFYAGADMERAILDRGFRQLKAWMEGIYRLKIRYNMLEDFVLKYCWSAFGYLISALPVFLPAWGGLGGIMELAAGGSGGSGGEHEPTGRHRERGRMQAFITNKRLMLSLADAGGRLMYSIKELSELAGSTSRVYGLIATLHRVQADAYGDAYPGARAPALALTPTSSASASTSAAARFSLADVQGTTQIGFDGVRLENVPVVAPAAAFPGAGALLLAAPLSFVVRPGEHLLISGGNGVGKSAVARIVAGLWPVFRGLVSRPRRVPGGQDGNRGPGRPEILFLPQRPYLSLGTLRDQVLYPHSAAAVSVDGEAADADAHLVAVLRAVRLEYLPEREGGWDARKEWKDVLSGGEKQRMAWARLFYHEPRYAFLDEATSAVSSDVEVVLYEEAKKRGITLITISTRPSLRKHHTYHLTLGTGNGTGTGTGTALGTQTPTGVGTGVGNDYTLERIGTPAETVGVERELADLQARLALVPAWRARKVVVDRELGRVWAVGAEGDGEGEGEKEGEKDEEKEEAEEEGDGLPASS
ncbi:MAG: hypothetical protein M1826_005158 [Phylliscum demangeonii]|nr:MAG: hypothetical protein M1826_005158 [Phylliscum demangeonii]